MDLSWKEHRLAGKLKLFSIAKPKSRDRWALALIHRMFNVSTAVVRCRDGVWESVFTVKERLDSIGVLADGSVVAVGDSVSVFFVGGNWSTVDSGLTGCHRIWGAHPGCVNALASKGLFCFDGGGWQHVDLKAQGIPGSFMDGDVDTRGNGWIVGWSGTFSCMAKGAGTNWQPDMCGSSYLYRVHAGEDGQFFTAGGDGLWQYDGKEWLEFDEAYDKTALPFPAALSSARGRPIVAGYFFEDIRRELRNSALVRTLAVYTGSGCEIVRLPAPVSLVYSLGTQLVFDTEARLLLVGQGPSIWESAPVSQAAPAFQSNPPRSG